MEQVGIINGLRTYIGVERGMYRKVSAEQLGAHVLKQLAVSIPKENIDLVIAGNAVGAGGNLARLMLLEAGLPENIPAITIDSQCSSGLEAIAMAAARIESGMADVVIAGGVESTSTQPIRIRNELHPDYQKNQENQYKVARFVPGDYDEIVMFQGAERIARERNIEKSFLDKYAIVSHQKAALAKKQGALEEILAEPFFKDNSNPAFFRTEQDEGIREKITPKLLERLPALVPNGNYITAGNACLTHDGAAFLLLCSRDYAKEHNLLWQAQVKDAVTVAANPHKSPESLIPAIQKLLARNYLSAQDITAWEYNEAFSVIDYLMEEEIGKDVGRYNIFGGAIAYGHPYGASGAIISLHLLQALKKLELPESLKHTGKKEAKKYGIAAVAAAGGIGSALLIGAGNEVTFNQGE